MASGIMEKDTMFYVGREKVWHNMGISVDEAPSSAEAIKIAGLDWEVKSVPMFINQGKFSVVDNVFANINTKTNDVLGVVTGKYKIVQNHEAFSFTDSLLGEGVKYETAGSLFNGKKIWLLARMPDSEIVGDKFENFLVFSNSHDGKGSIQIACTSTRVVCNNTLSMALSGAKRSWTTKHMGVMEAKLAEAHHTLELATKYQEAFAQEANILADQKFDDLSFTMFVENLIPINKADPERKIKNLTDMREELIIRYNAAPDLSSIRGTKWGVLQAVSDFATHRTPKRLTDSYQENLFDETIQGNKMIDKAYDLLSA